MIERQPLGTLLRTVKGKKPKDLSEGPAPGLLPYIDISAVEHCTRRQWAEPSQARVVPAGTLVMVWDGARSGLVGFTPFEGALGSTLVALDSPLEKRYVAAFLRLHFADINSNHRGSGIPHVNPDFLKGLTIPILSGSEQRLIAKVSDTVGEKEASARTHISAARNTIGRFCRGVLVAASSGALTADWRDKHVDASGRRLVESFGDSSQPNRPNESNAFDEFERLRGIPDSWGRARFDLLTTNHDGRRVPVKSTDRGKKQGPYPYYGASGIIDHVDDYLFDGDHLLVSEDGANLLARSTAIAFRASGKFWVNNHAHVIKGKPGVLDAYLEVVLNGRDLQTYITGSAQPKLTQAALNALPVAVPSTAEQDEIVRRVHQLLTLASELSKRIDVAEGKTRRISQAVLAKAFRGELSLDESNGASESTKRSRKAAAPSGVQRRAHGRGRA